jgi:hypothetical protein
MFVNTASHTLTENTEQTYRVNHRNFFLSYLIGYRDSEVIEIDNTEKKQRSKSHEKQQDMKDC